MGVGVFGGGEAGRLLCLLTRVCVVGLGCLAWRRQGFCDRQHRAATPLHPAALVGFVGVALRVYTTDSSLSFLSPLPLECLRVCTQHRYAGVRLAAQRSLAGWLSETTGGLSYLEFIRTLNKRVEEDWEGVQVRGAQGGGCVCVCCEGCVQGG